MASASLTCPHCGHAVATLDATLDGHATCPRCGHELEPESGHARASSPTPTADSTASNADSSAVFPALRAIRQCRSCGRELDLDAIICTACGLNQKTGRRLRTDLTDDPEIAAGQPRAEAARPGPLSVALDALGALPWPQVRWLLILGAGIGFVAHAFVYLTRWEEADRIREHAATVEVTRQELVDIERRRTDYRRRMEEAGRETQWLTELPPFTRRIQLSRYQLNDLAYEPQIRQLRQRLSDQEDWLATMQRQHTPPATGQLLTFLTVLLTATLMPPAIAWGYARTRG